jgi:hypothetical protein
VSRRGPASHRVEVQADPVGDDRLQADGPVRAAHELVGQLGGVRGRGRAAAGHLLGHRLDPYDLVRPRVAETSHLLGRQQGLVGQAGVDAEVGDAGGAEQPPVHLLGPEFRPPVKVCLGSGVLLQAEDRRAPTADRQADRAVEVRGAGRRRTPFGDESLEGGARQVVAAYAVAMLIDERHRQCLVERVACRHA